VTPNVLLVHNIQQAKGVIDAASKTSAKLVVVYGHDHKASVKKKGSITLVDVGTSGASSYADIGNNAQSPYTFQILEMADGSTPRLVSVDTLTYAGVDGTATVEHIPINN